MGIEVGDASSDILSDGNIPNQVQKDALTKAPKRAIRLHYSPGMSFPFKKRLRYGLISTFLVLILLSTSFFSFTASAQSVTYTDLNLGQKSANMTVTKLTSKYLVSTEEYSITADYSTPFIEYRIQPYFSSDYILYKRVNPQYPGDGTVDQYGNALDSVKMTISSYGQSGNTVWFLESCTEFSLKQSFTIYRDYFELNVTYTPGSKNVLTTYYIGLYSSTGSLYKLTNGQFNRYIPGFDEQTTSGYGIGGWYPSMQMYAPACDLRAPGRNLGVEWGYSDTVAYIYSPLWLSGGHGGSSVMALKYSSLNSIVPNIALGTQQTFHLFVRPYQYSDGKQQGHDVGYAQWVAPIVAAKYGHHSTPVFPLSYMNMGTWSTSTHSWVESSQIKVAVYSNNPNQIDWNYKSAQLANKNPDTPSNVPKSWQMMTQSMTPLTSGGNAICNPVSGPYTTSGTYRWQLINNDPNQAWWTSSSGVFWDGINLWTSTNTPKNDYQQRTSTLYDGYLALIKDTYSSGYWDYVIANSYTALLHLSIATDLTIIEGYEPSSHHNTDLTKHVQSTMDFVNNIPAKYRPNILVYQSYSATDSNDQNDVYSALFGAAKYSYMIDLTCYDSFEAQEHNLVMAEDMFEAMGCTQNSDVRTISVDTLDLATSTTLSTAASMVVMKGTGTPMITSTAAPSTFKLTNLLGSTRSFNLAFASSYYYGAGTNVQSTSSMTFTTDGKGTFHGSIAAEKTGEIVKNSNLMVQQKTSGTISVKLVSLTSTSAELNLAATGGSTTITMKGLKASSSFNIYVDGVLVSTITSGSDGSLSFSRTYDSSDVLKVQLNA